MAGIAFELKKIYKKKTLVSYIRGSAFATIATIGPMLITVSLLTILKSLLNIAGINDNDSAFYVAAITYAFLLATILSAVFSNIVSRYISDCVYLNKYKEIGASVFGVLTVCTVASGITMLLLCTLLFNKEVSLLFICVYYCFGVLLSDTYCMMIYASALKQYKEMTTYFIVGLVSAIIVFLVCTDIFSIELLTSALLGLAACFLIIMSSLIIECARMFSIPTNNYFEFLKYFSKYPKLLFAGIAYTISVYTPTILYWYLSSLGQPSLLFRIAPIFDSALFRAILINSTALIIFVIRVETAFYEKYSVYVSSLNHGTLSLIDKERTVMIQTLMRELTFIYKIQFIITLTLTYLMATYLVGINLSYKEIFLSVILNFWVYTVFCSNLTTIIYYYFADYTKASYSSAILLLLTIIGTLITIAIDCYYPVLLLLGGVLSWILSVILLKVLLKDINKTLICMSYKD